MLNDQNIKSKNAPLNYVSMSILIIIIFGIAACKHDSAKTVAPGITGCMDEHATNYNANATISATCTYPLQSIAGRYRVTDTFYYFVMTSATTGKNDTAITTEEINVTFVDWNTVKCDKIISCSNCDSSGGINIYENNSFYYSSYSNGYFLASGTGKFSNDSLVYNCGKVNSIGGTDTHKGKGVKE